MHPATELFEQEAGQGASRLLRSNNRKLSIIRAFRVIKNFEFDISTILPRVDEGNHHPFLLNSFRFLLFFQYLVF